MVDDLPGALGTAAEGSLFARAIEDERGGGVGRVTVKGGHFQEGDCLNCGTALIGSHCHSCGQQAHLHRTLGAFMHDLLHGALHFEGKMWSTLPLLALKPGQLTRRYIEGERKKFVSPMALFLFGVFLMFAVFQMVGLTTPTTIGTADVMTGQVENAVSQMEDRVSALETQTKNATDEAERAQLESDLADAREALEGLQTGREYVGAKYASNDFVLTGNEAIDHGLLKKWKENPGLMLYKLQANSYKFSWLLIPLSIPFVWILFAWKRRFKAYDHAIFITYSLSFMTLLFVVLSLFTLIPSLGWMALTAMLFVPPIHLYKQLRGAYSLSRFSAFWRLLALSLFIWVVIVLFLQVLVVLGAL